MSFSFEIKGAETIGALLLSLRKSIVDDEFLEEVAGAARAGILRRTAEGRDVEGAAFRPYSRAWRKERRKMGRGTSPVDLRLTGRMLDSIGTEVNPEAGEAVVFVEAGEESVKARAHTSDSGGKGAVRREFMGIGGADVESLKDIIHRHMGRAVKWRKAISASR